MLKKRLIGAAAVLTPIAILLFLDDRSPNTGVWLLPLILVAGLVGTDEVVGLMRGGGLTVHRLPVFFGGLLVLSAACMSMFYAFPPDCPVGPWGMIASAMVAATWVSIVDEMRRYKEPGGVVQRISLQAFAVVYVALPICFLVQLRLLHPNRTGLMAVISMIFVVKVADSGAYFAGKSMGKHKMAPILSPKKTWEGAGGGIVSAVFAAVFFLLWVLPTFTDAEAPGFWAVVAYGAALAIVGMVGDLGESLIKRDLQQKDSASWLPGLGGVLDMLDSLLLAAPVGYLFWAAGILV